MTPDTFSLLDTSTFFSAFSLFAVKAKFHTHRTQYKIKLLVYILSFRSLDRRRELNQRNHFVVMIIFSRVQC